MHTPKMKYTLKDSVFTFIFKQPEYTRQLYLAATYKEYAEEQKLNLYGTEPVAIPRPELYVVYTGDREDVPETLLLSDLYGGSGDAEVRVKVLRGTGNGDIVDQYVRFCKIADEERKRHGRSGKAIEETLRRCIKENVLAPFLLTHHKKVTEVMVTSLFKCNDWAQIDQYGGGVVSIPVSIYCDSMPGRIPFQFGGFILRNGDDAMELDTLASLFSFSMRNSLIAI